MTRPVAGGARHVLRNTVVLASSRIMDRASTFVLAVVIAPKLGPRGLGTYSAAMAVYSVMSIAGEAGTTSFLVREIARDESRTGSYVVHLSVMALGVCGALTVVLEAITPHLYSGDLRTSVAIVELAALGTVLNSIQEAAFVAYGRTEFEAISTFVQAVLYVGIGAWLLHTGHGIPALMKTYVGLEYAVTAVYFVLIARCIAPLRLQFRWQLAKKLATEIRAFTASSALAALFARPEVIILSLLATSTQVGYYGAAVRIAELPLFAPQVFMANVFPLMSRAHGVDEERFRSLHDRSLKYMLAFALPITGFVLATAPFLIDRLFGDSFRAAVTPLRLLAFNILFFSLIAVHWRTLYARGRQADVLRVQIAVIVCRIAGGAALIAPFSALGAGVAATAISAGHVTLLTRASARAGVRSPLVRLGWRYAAAAAVMGAAAWFVGRTYGLTLTIATAVVVFLAACALDGGIGADERRLLASLRTRAPDALGEASP